MNLGPELTKAVADLDSAAKRLVRATAPNLCMDCSEPCGYVETLCPMCKARAEKRCKADAAYQLMLEHMSGCFDLIDQEGD